MGIIHGIEISAFLYNTKSTGDVFCLEINFINRELKEAKAETEFSSQ